MNDPIVINDMAYLYLGDCLATLRTMPDACVDSIVTDPPYGLSFMGKRWDYDVPSVEVWAECLRVLKPGGYLLAFAGTRTQHRMAVRIEDAGFEIRDMIAWVYGSGFPKSLDVSKAIDKAAGVEREVISERPAYGIGGNGCLNGHAEGATAKITAPATDAARKWQGWGTALKPALEPITVARKPLDGTVAANVLAHGTGALNIDGCRVPTGGEQPKGSGARGSWRAMEGRTDLQPHGENVTPDSGRWPANLIHDGSDEVMAAFSQAKGQQGAVGPQHGAKASVNVYGDYGPRDQFEPRGDTGSAARFFYCAKASRSDRGAENSHPTVKPTDLMRYLCRLVTPPGGVVLDPFMGSGSTGKAAVLESFQFVGCELSPEYLAIAQARIAAAKLEQS